MKHLIHVLFLFSFIAAKAQLTIHGYVIDAETKQAMPGTTIVEGGTTNGTISDIDGKFRLYL
ncbi:carboxypeptidase-like regulatory domain-containing protein [Carboxylicivirga sp. RSCT41]|uniref:carboxypeptidase-like regulatory domain-containing protein n=1 Tax=Carboxylicivirga agarovorans TaxID=3417570 RepID=UPI003D336E25